MEFELTTVQGQLRQGLLPQRAGGAGGQALLTAAASCSQARLDLVSGQVCIGNNGDKALVDAAVKAMDGYEGAYCMESFDPRCVHVLKKKYPHIIRGQLTEDFFNSESKLPAPLKWVLKHQVLNFLTLPDFVAYNYRDLDAISNTIVRKFWGVTGVTWTLRTQEEFDDATRKGWIPIFENFNP